MSVSFAVVHEAELDFLTATELADRVLLEAIEWLDEELLTNQRIWLAETVDGARFTWKGIKQLARDAGIRVHGHFEGEPGLPDAAAARRAILFLLRTVPAVNAIVLIRDQDDQPERKTGLEQARNQDHSGMVIVVACRENRNRSSTKRPYWWTYCISSGWSRWRRWLQGATASNLLSIGRFQGGSTNEVPVFNFAVVGSLPSQPGR